MTVTDTVHIAKVLANLDMDELAATKIIMAFADDFELSFKRSNSFKRHEFIDKFWRLRALAQQRKLPIARKYISKNTQPTTE